MCSALALTASYILLFSAAVLSAPLVDKQNEVKKRSVNTGSDIPDQDKELQDLLNLVHKESKQKDVVVHKEEISHFENNNGQKVEVQSKEEKVVDKSTGKLIADVKQEVKQESTGTGAKPETVVETKVDIPAEGVHESFVQEDGQSENGNGNPSNDPDTELTPADMAEYLYVTQRFSDFYAALERLVNHSKMTAAEAEMYTKAVAMEYERLQLEDFEERIANEKRQYPQVPQDIDLVSQDSVLDVYPQSRQELGNEERYQAGDYYGYPAGYMNQEDQASAQQEADIDPYEFLAALWNEAYGKGNEEAQEIVKMLYDRVSQDDNPDDMGQIRDLLLETIASSMSEEPKNVQVPSANPQILVPVEISEKKKKDQGKEIVKEVQQKQEKVEKQEIKTEVKVDKVKEQTATKPEQQKQ